MLSRKARDNPCCPVTVKSHYKLLPFPPNTSRSSSCDLFCFYKWVWPTVSTNQHTICIRVLLNIHCWVRPMCLGLEPSLAKRNIRGLHKLGEVQNTNHQRRHSAARHKEQDSRQRRLWGNHHERSKGKGTLQDSADITSYNNQISKSNKCKHKSCNQYNHLPFQACLINKSEEKTPQLHRTASPTEEYL